MTPAQPTPTVPPLHKYACTVCARRKVRCDRTDQCSNCTRAKVQCLYQAPGRHRPRKRRVNDDSRNNVDVKQPDGTATNVWIPSGLEPGLGVGVGQEDATPSKVQKPINESLERCRWSSLSAELRNPPMQSFPPRESLHGQETSVIAESFQAMWPTTPVVELHPDPRHIFRLWQIFVENVNPLTKVIHVPTLQQRIMEASWNLDSVTKPTEAIMFAVYSLALTSLGSLECQQLFGEDKSTLLKRYRTATIQALMAAGLLTTRDLDVLQAFVLFLLADPYSDLTSTLTALARRIGHKMGLHEAHDPNTSKLPFFEQEMRVRTWWQLRGYDSRTGRTSSAGSFYNELGSFYHDFGSLRLPLNVNDADLHHSMTGPPIEHTGPTEMLYVLMKYEGGSWLRKSPTAAKWFPSSRELVQVPQTQDVKDAAVAELEVLYETKYLCKCDPRIPLHAISITMTRLAIARTRFRVHHPRLGDGIEKEGVNDILFQNGVLLLQLGEETRRSRYAAHLLSHMTERSQIDAFVYVVSELRRRCAGELVEVAWRVVEGLYMEHPELIEEEDNSFYMALGDLALEAWGMRQMELIRSNGPWEADAAPQFIKLLKSKREKGASEAVQTAVEEPIGGFILGVGTALDWDCWDDLIGF